MFRMEFLEVGELPKLAWCAKVQNKSNTVYVEHGAWVETHGNFFVEGVWNGEFDSANFADAETILGSAGRVEGEHIVFSTTTHTMERLHSARVDDKLLVSNSLLYLLTVMEDSVDNKYVPYERDFLTVLKGYNKAKKYVPTARGRRVRVHYNEHIVVDKTLRIHSRRPKDVPRFTTYEEYVGYLQRLLEQIERNATSDKRRITFRPLATVSSGYDSPACAILAKDIGCKEAVTFDEARAEHNVNTITNTGDAGDAIATCIGLDVTQFPRCGYLSKDDSPEAEFLAVGNGGDDIVMSVLEDKLPATLFFTGFRGDTVWDLARQDTEACRYFKTKDPSGASLGEFRLRVGFVHVPIPALTFTSYPDLLKISLSEDMAPWRLNNGYDRPIPRRLVESRGVPRDAFGQEKKAITQPYWVTKDNESMFSQVALRDLEKFTADVLSDQRQRHRRKLQRAIGSAILSGVWRSGKLSEKLGLEYALKFPMSYRLWLSNTTYKFHWAVQRTIGRYRMSQL